MVLKLYGWRPSPPVRAVMVVLYEKGVSFEFINIELHKSEHKKPGYSTIHPFTQVPVIDDDGFRLYESRAICQYLHEKYSNQGTKLIPTDLRKRALVEQAAWAEAYHFGMHAKPILFEYTVRHRLNGKELNMERIAKETKSLLTTVDYYEQLLSKQNYIAGDEFSVADIYHLPSIVDLIEIANIDIFKGRPCVERWAKEIIARESWRRVKERLGSMSKL